MKKIPDWLERALKTFVQAFFGIAEPEVCLILSGRLPEDWEGWVTVLIPVGCSALAAGISAGWNALLEHFRAEDGEV